jgi:hypothetical protein
MEVATMTIQAGPDFGTPTSGKTHLDFIQILDQLQGFLRLTVQGAVASIASDECLPDTRSNAPASIHDAL